MNLIVVVILAAIPCLATSLQRDYEVQQKLNYDDNDDYNDNDSEYNPLMEVTELATTPTKNKENDCYKFGAEDVNGNSASERAIPLADDIFMCWLRHKKELAALRERLKLKRRKCNQKEINFRSAYNTLPALSRKVQLNDIIMKPKFKTEYDLLMNVADGNQDKVEESRNEVNFLNDLKSFQQTRSKRDPISVTTNQEDGPLFKAPHYPYAFAPFYSYRNNKREIPEPANFIPSISAVTMTNLGHFFKDLSKNVNFSEKMLLGNDEHKLLLGDHPLRVLHDQMSENVPNTGKTAEFLQAIRSYRPSQQIRSLVDMNPEGYRGSHLIDPNYMWVGLGK